MSIGQNIKTVRKGKNMTQESFSELVGLSRSYLSDLENDRKNASIETIVKLSISSKVEISHFLHGLGYEVKK